jgi:hypothetical protein
VVDGGRIKKKYKKYKSPKKKKLGGLEGGLLSAQHSRKKIKIPIHKRNAVKIDNAL